jgi:hypothetical protein
MPDLIERPAVAAGWYADPEQPSLLRWWDGTTWTEHRAAREAGPEAQSRDGKAAAPGRSPRRWVAAAIGVLAVLAVLSVGGNLLWGPEVLDDPPLTEGEVWEDTLGQTMDSYGVLAWTQACGLFVPEPRNVCRPGGWELRFHPQTMTVEGVLLYGLVDSEIQRYQGRLPNDLDWDWTLGELLAAWGEPAAITGGNGVQVQVLYPGDGGERIAVHLTALYQRDVVDGTGIHHIEVTR